MGIIRKMYVMVANGRIQIKDDDAITKTYPAEGYEYGELASTK